MLCSLENLTELSHRICPAANKLNLPFILAPPICEIDKNVKHKRFRFLPDNFFLFQIQFFFTKMLQNCADTQKQSIRGNFQKFFGDYPEFLPTKTISVSFA